MGSTIPFSPAAIAARYGTRDAFLTQIRTAAETLAAQRYLLSEDIPAIVSASANRWDQFTTSPSGEGWGEGSLADVRCLLPCPASGSMPKLDV